MIEQSVHLVPGLSARDVQIADVDVWRFRGHLTHPLRTARAEIEDRETLILRIQADIAGFSVSGWGEAAPLDGWGTDKLSQVKFELGRLRDMVIGGATADPLELLAKLSAPTARFAFTSALLDAIAHARRRPLRHVIDPAAPNSIALNATIGLEGPAKAVEIAKGAWAQGFRTLKLKAGDDEDVERVRRVREALPDAVLRLDANGAWDLDQAVEQLTSLSEYEIDYVEQPVGDAELLIEVRARSSIAIAADESCVPLAAAWKLVDQRAVDVLVLKPALLGAWGETMSLVSAAQAAGMRVIFTSALDSAVGRSATAQIAAAMLSAEVACGLATNWFETDLGGGEDRVRGGRLYLGSGNGLGLLLKPHFMMEST